MQDELAKQLCGKFPIIYRCNYLERGGNDFSLPFYFECEDGWYNLIYTYSEQLEKIAKLFNPQTTELPLVVQVKEKFGGLRIYTHNLPEEYRAIRSLAIALESQSYKVCEDCGEPGKPRKSAWIKTWCDDCFNKGTKQ